MTDQAIIFGDVKQISFSQLRIEHGIAGESNYRILTIESGNGGKFNIKLCGNAYNLKAIRDEELEAFLEDADEEEALFSMIEAETKEQLPRDERRTMSCLLLTNIADVPSEVISGWTDEQCEQVEEWAMSLHLVAGDNEGVLIPQTPECLAEYTLPCDEGKELQ